MCVSATKKYILYNPKFNISSDNEHLSYNADILQIGKENIEHFDSFLLSRMDNFRVRLIGGLSLISTENFSKWYNDYIMRYAFLLSIVRKYAYVDDIESIIHSLDRYIKDNPGKSIFLRTSTLTDVLLRCVNYTLSKELSKYAVIFEKLSASKILTILQTFLYLISGKESYIYAI